jgi:Icc-related predicted phosphoesterase
MKIHCISDTHTKHRELNLHGGEVLIHAGDIMGSGYKLSEITDFLQWFAEQDYKHKIFIAGNHDRIFEENPDLMFRILQDEYPEIIYLENKSVTIDGIKFYGSPHTTEFMGWAFALDNDWESEEMWSRIDDDTDVLITHGPAYGYLDEIKTPLRPGMTYGHLGCPMLAKRIEEINPKLHICGHIHSSQGVLDGYGEVSTHINASCLGEDYKFINNTGYIEWEVHV